MSNNYNYTDTTPYLLRQTGNGNISVYGTNRADDTLVGAAVNVNQLVNESNFVIGTDKGITSSLSNHTLKLTGTTTGGYNYTIFVNTTLMSGHKYLVTGLVKNVGAGLAFYSGAGTYTPIFPGGNTKKETIVAITVTSNTYQYYANAGKAGTEIDVEIVPQVIDLTAMLGSTIADYLYSIETATAGAGVAKLQEWGFITDEYIPYNPGTLESVEARSHVLRGFNQWDEEWEVGGISISNGQNTPVNNTIRSTNYSPCIGGNTYYFNGSGTTKYIFWYDANKQFISYQSYASAFSGTAPTNARFFRIRVDEYGTTYNHDICINISDPSRNGEYEPYVKHEYPLDNSLTLRGIPKLDANNNLYYDGDEYASDGTVTRKYGIVDLGTLAWGMAGTGRFYSSSINTLIKKGSSSHGYNLMIADGFVAENTASVSILANKGISVDTGGNVQMRDDAYTTASDFRASLDGVMGIYELSTPTTENADPFTNPQICDPDGTEEYVTSNGVPVGHETKYFVAETEVVEPTIEHVLDHNGLVYLWARLKQRFSRATNLVNGSAEGSLRSVGSKTEDSNYTIGTNSLALGVGTLAASQTQIALGNYNVSDPDDTYAVIIGNGTADNARSNALTVAWDGNTYIDGTLDVQLGITSTSSAYFQDDVYVGSNKYEWNEGTGCFIGGDGSIALQAVTSNSNAYDSSNPHITFLNAAGNQNVQLIYTDYDTVQSPASLTLVGNRGGEYFIAPNIKATGSVIATTGVGTNGKGAAADGITGVWINNAGNAHLVGAANTGSGIYFYYNKATSSTAYIMENASGQIKISGKLVTGGVIMTGSKTAWDTGTGCYIGTEGMITLQGTTTATNTYAGSLPRIRFLNVDGSQNLALVYTDYDTVQSPASLTLAGSQGGEWFIAPNVGISQLLKFTATTDTNILQGIYNSTTYGLLRNHANGNISLNSASGGLYLGYANTTSINFLNGKLFINSSGDILGNGSKTAIRPNVDAWLRINDKDSYTSGVYFGTSTIRADSIIQSGYATSSSGYSYINLGNVFAGKQNGEPKVYASILNSSGSITNHIYMYANSDGRVGIYSHRADGTAVSILSRGNNSSVIEIGGAVGTVNLPGYYETSKVPVVSNSTNGQRVGSLRSYATNITVYAQWNAGSGASYTSKSLAASSSDIRLKENIVDSKVDALALLNQIRIREFDWKDNREYIHQPIGMIADEIEKLDPRFSIGGGYDENGCMSIKSVDTFYLTGYLVKAVQELSLEIEQLKNKK